MVWIDTVKINRSKRQWQSKGILIECRECGRRWQRWTALNWRGIIEKLMKSVGNGWNIQWEKKRFSLSIILLSIWMNALIDECYKSEWYLISSENGVEAKDEKYLWWSNVLFTLSNPLNLRGSPVVNVIISHVQSVKTRIFSVVIWSSSWSCDKWGHHRGGVIGTEMCNVSVYLWWCYSVT